MTLVDSRQAERAILGACLADPQGLHYRAAVDTGLVAQDLGQPGHRATWEAICGLRGVGAPVDLITVSAELAELFARPAYQGAGIGPGWLADLVLEAPALPESTAAHARIVRTAHIQMLQAGAAADLQVRPGDPAALRRLQELQEREQEVQAPRTAFPAAADRVLQLWSTPRPPSVPTPFPDLTHALGGGFIRGRNTLLIGATGRGKTGLAIQLARHWLSAGWPVLYLSTELPEDEAYARFLGQHLRRPWREVWNWGPSVAPDLRDRAAESLGGLALLEHRPDQALAPLVRRFARERGRAPIVVVDVAQDLATAAVRGGADARAATRVISAEAKAIAREHQTVVLLLSHTSRAFSRDREAAQLRGASEWESAGRDSADLEQDSAVVLGLDTDDCPAGGSSEARLHLAKVSGGGRGQTVGLRFHGALGLFEEEPQAGLAPELRQALEAIRAGATTAAQVRAVLGCGNARAQELVRMLVIRGLVRRTAAGRSSVLTVI